MQTLPLTKDLVLIGGGHTHALLLRMWGMNPLAGVRLTVINPGPVAAYSGMLPGFVAGHYTRDELDIDLVKLARFAGARLINGAVTAIDRESKRITLPGYPPIGYDVCSLDIGITSDMPSLPGFGDHGIPAKPLGPFAEKWDAFRTSHTAPNITVIGGGVAGAELAMAMKFAMSDAHVRLLDRGTALSALQRKGRAALKNAMSDLGVELVEDVTVTAITSDEVRLDGKDAVPSDFTVGAAGAKPFDWQSEIGVTLHDGYIAVGPTLQSSDASIFAVGDCAHLTASPRPKAGVFAVREAPYLFDNLRGVLSGGALTEFHPQSDYLKLISLGGQTALAEKFGHAFKGRLLWKWKDQIDRKFMDQFDALEPMSAVAVPRTHALGMIETLGDKPLCGGCGSKVGKSALQSALAGIPDSQRPDVQKLAGDDAGLIVHNDMKQVISTDHLRSFTLDPVLMTQVTALHALGDIWAMGAAPQAVTVNVILPQMSAELQERSMAEIMAAAHAVFDDAGATIVGGHSSMGAEFTVGFTVTGLCDNPPITLAGAKAGDVLILTKSIGTGVVLAGEMAGQTKGQDVIDAHKQMLVGQGAASRILAKANAMTDVTGFGLLGHLWGMCEASGVSVEVDQSTIPMLDGAKSLSVAGVRSSIFGSNVESVGVIIGQPHDLLFDPQTAGGLVAAVPEAIAQTLIRQLKDTGYARASIIGRILEGEPTIKVI